MLLQISHNGFLALALNLQVPCHTNNYCPREALGLHPPNQANLPTLKPTFCLRLPNNVGLAVILALALHTLCCTQVQPISAASYGGAPRDDEQNEAQIGYAVLAERVVGVVFG